MRDVWNSSVSTEITDDSEEPPLHSLPLYKLSMYLWCYASPIILLLGNFGNVMTILIMHRMKSGEAVFNIYFTALAIIDLVTLDTFLLFEWIGIAFKYSFKFTNNPICKIYNWISTSSTTIGGWFLVGLTTHRAVSVVWPHRVNVICTRRLVVGLIVGIAAFHAAVYSHYMYGYRLVYVNSRGMYRCIMVPGAYLTFVTEIFTYIDLILYSLLPFTCIVFANSVLVWKLRDSVREIRQKFAEKGSEQVSAREKAANSVTWTVLLVSVAYVVLTLPAAVYYITTFVFDTSAVMSNSATSKVHAISAGTFMLLYCNSAVNFYLYCLTGERFRKEFVKMFCPARFQGASLG